MKINKSLAKILRDSRRRKRTKKSFQSPEEFRDLGIPRRGYQLAPPIARKRATVGEQESASDPRTVYLQLPHR
jgi:hypothetical protein